MHEGFIASAVPAESRPIPSDDASTATGPGLEDPRALQILTTEHWSLLTARSLVYNETFTRAGMFLAFLSATLLVLGLISTATGFSDTFLVIATIVLALDLVVGIASLGRITAASNEDLLYLQGMNRLRHAYLEMVPSVSRYFITSGHDDFDSVAVFYGAAVATPLGNLVHGYTTIPGMIGIICSALGGGLAGILTMLATRNAGLAAFGGIAAFLVLNGLLLVYAYRTIRATQGSFVAIFPRPGAGTPDREV